MLGFNYLSTAGLVLNSDSSAYDIITAPGLSGAMFAKGVSGTSVGLAMSFELVLGVGRHATPFNAIDTTKYCH